MIGPGQHQLDDRTPPMTPQLALRVAVVGGVALVLFGVIFFRLWFLQVLDSTQYAKAADNNITRQIPVQGPRGEILASNGQPLVESQQVPAVSISPVDLPVRLTAANMLYEPAQDLALYRRLAPVLKMSNRPRACKITVYYTGHETIYDYNRDVNIYYDGRPTTDTAGTAPKMSPIECAVAKGVAGSEYANTTIKTDVSPDVRAYIDERQTHFQGVLAQDVYLRKYPFGQAGAQLFGSLGPVTALELKQDPNFKGVAQSDVVGQDGLEYEYDQYLRGIDGYEAVKVNSENQFEGYGKGKAPQIGDNVRLSLNPQLERVGQQSLERSIAANASAGANGGAFIAMDPQNGQVYAMGSAPSYSPSIFEHPISEKYWRHLNAKSSGYPLQNKAIDGGGPDGSTFKVITAIAALQSGRWQPNQTYNDATGTFCYPGTNHHIQSNCLHNSSGANHVPEVGGVLNLETAIEMSDDVFFYNLGYKLNDDPQTHPQGGPLEQWARKFGLGQQTGVDLPGEGSGLIPTPKVIEKLNYEEYECENATGQYAYTNSANGAISNRPHGPTWHRSKKFPNGCGIGTGTGWTVGDNVNTGVGQGDVQVTPLQLAVAYSAIENGGKIVVPHLAQDVQNQAGIVQTRIDPPAKRHLNINPVDLNTIRQGLYLAAHGPIGTSSDVMGNFKMPVYGKTGTAQLGTAQQIKLNTAPNYAWYACYVPASATHKPIVVVVWVAKGGFGDVAAAPVARQILSQWFYGKPGPFVTGTSTDQ